MGAPAPDRSAVDGLTYLNRARGAYRPLSLIEGEAARVPFEPAMNKDTPSLAFQIGDDVLVADVQDTSRRQDPVPMLHQRLIAPAVAAELCQIVGMMLDSGEQLGEAGHAGIDGIADGVNDARIGQRQMNET